jgi:transposase
MQRHEVAAILASHEQLTTRVDELTRQLEWFKQQLFGSKSERRLVDPGSRQLALGEWRHPEAPGQEITVAEHRRRSRPRPDADTEEGGLRFDDSVPVEEIRIDPPELDEGHEIIGQKETCRLAQKPASYVVLRYIRPVIKRKADGKITCAPAPAAVLGKSLADVSLLACMAIDKFRFHLTQGQSRPVIFGPILAESH